jgi:hypothetical protein
MITNKGIKVVMEPCAGVFVIDLDFVRYILIIRCHVLMCNDFILYNPRQNGTSLLHLNMPGCT